MTSLTLSVGQPVPWPHAPMGIAQVADLMRTRVRLCYPTRKGQMRFPLVRATRVAELLAASDPILPLANPLSRGVLPRSKTFDV